MTRENDKAKSIEKALEKALYLWEEGKSFQEILDIFPEHKREIEELFEVIEFIKKEKLRLMPQKEILNKILSQIEVSGITKMKENRYIYQEQPKRLKGRLFNFQAKMDRILNFMEKRAYLLTGTVVVILAVAIGIYWYSQRPKLAELPATEELKQETEGLSQDILELETMAEDKNLDTLETDLLAVAEEIPLEQELPSISVTDVSEIENLEKELSAELEGILNDLADLEEFEGDTSLNNLDTSLSDLAQ